MASPFLKLPKTIGKAMSGVFLDAVLTRATLGSTEPPYSSYDPGPPGTATYSCKALASEYSAGTRGQGLVGATDMRVLILSTSLGTEPQPLDRVSIPVLGFAGQIPAGDVTGVKPVATDPAKAAWDCRVVT